jgi:hypothetical protein
LRRARTSLLALASLSYTSNRPLCCTLTASAEEVAAKLPGESFLDSPLASACSAAGNAVRDAHQNVLHTQSGRIGIRGAVSPRALRSSMSKFQLLTPRTYLRARIRISTRRTCEFKRKRTLTAT